MQRLFSAGKFFRAIVLLYDVAIGVLMLCCVVALCPVSLNLENVSLSVVFVIDGIMMAAAGLILFLPRTPRCWKAGAWAHGGTVLTHAMLFCVNLCFLNRREFGLSIWDTRGPYAPRPHHEIASAALILIVPFMIVISFLITVIVAIVAVRSRRSSESCVKTDD